MRMLQFVSPLHYATRSPAPPTAYLAILRYNFIRDHCSLDAASDLFQLAASNACSSCSRSPGLTVSTATPRIAGGISSTESNGPFADTKADSNALRSSRMFPGHEYRVKQFHAS